MSRPTTEDREEIDRAVRNVRAIDELNSLPAFQEFIQSFQREADALADQVLHSDMTHEKRENIRQRYLGIRDVLMAPARDRAANVRILERHGQG